MVISCNKNFTSNTDGTNDEPTAPLNVRWGTYFNTLRGVTICWQNYTAKDSLCYGYNADYEMGIYPISRQLKEITYLHTDKLRLVPQWNNKADLYSLIGKEIRLKFFMQNAKLYSFKFNN